MEEEQLTPKSGLFNFFNSIGSESSTTDQQNISSISSTSSSSQIGTSSNLVTNLDYSQQATLFALWNRVISELAKPFDLESAFQSSLISQPISATINHSQPIDPSPLINELWNQCGCETIDSILIRFLRARAWVLEDAYSMLLDAVRWRRISSISTLLQAGEASFPARVFETNCSFWWNTDKHNRPVLVISGSILEQAQLGPQLQRFTIWQMEIGRRMFQPGISKVMVLFNLTKVSITGFDLEMFQFLIQTFQAFYPETLGKLLFFNAPWLFFGIWVGIKTLLDPVVAKKVEFVDSESIQNFISQDRLLTMFGGSGQFDYSSLVRSLEADLMASEHKLNPPKMDRLSLAIQDELKVIQILLVANTAIIIQKVAKQRDKDKTALADFLTARDRLNTLLTVLGRTYEQLNYPKTIYHQLGIIQPESVVWP